MSNPITEWIRGNMAPPQQSENEMERRIAEQSLASQRTVDERKGPVTAGFFVDYVDRRVKKYDHVFIANADLKAFKCGLVNSPEAAIHYCSLALHRRHQLLKKFPNPPEQNDNSNNN